MKETCTADETGIETNTFKKITHGTSGKHLIAREIADSYSMPLLPNARFGKEKQFTFAAMGKRTTEDDSILY